MTEFRRASRTLGALATLASLVFLFSLAWFGPVLAQGQSLYWQRYDVDITVQESGNLRVVETQEIVFTNGTFNEGVAVLQMEKTDGLTDFSIRENGVEYTLTSNDTNDPNTFYFTRVADGLEVAWNIPGTRPGTHTYEIAYTVKGAIRQYGDGDQLQWKAVSSERDFGVQSSTITVHLPGNAVPLEGRIVAFSPVQVEWSVPETGLVIFQPVRALGAGEGVEIGLALDPAVVTGPVPAWQQAFDAAEARRALIGTISVIALALTAVAVPVVLYLLWRFLGRDPDPGVVPEYIAEPPSDLPPGVIGTLIDETADTPDVVATLVDMARKGALTIEENAAPGDFGQVKRGYVLRKQPMPEGLAEYEKTLYNSLFEKEESRKMDALEGTLFATFQRIRKQLYDEVVKRGLFTANPDSVRGRYRGLGIAGIFVFGLAAFCSIISLGGDAAFVPCVPLAMGLGSIALIFMAPNMPAKTRKGSEEAAKWRAFKKYLENIDKYRDLKEATDLFEKFLPYAIAFGLDRRFVAAFSKVPATPVPRWYVPTYGPNVFPGQTAGLPGAQKTSGVPVPAGLPGGAGPVVGGGMPSLGEIGGNLGGGLQSFSDGMVTMLNTTARTLNVQPTPVYTPSSGGGGSTFRGTSVRTGSRGFSGGSFRSSGGGFRSGGGGGGGRRGFR